MRVFFFFFFFKQKTAYEMSIGDWSSDVCSSDLRHKDDRPERARAADERAVLKTLPSWFSGRNSFQSIASLRTQPFTSRVRCPGHIDTGQFHRGVCRRGGEEDI